MFGVDIDRSGALGANALFLARGVWPENIIIKPYDFLTNTVYDVTMTLRSTGADIFVQGGEYSVPTLLWRSDINSTSTLYVGISGLGIDLDLLHVGVLTELWMMSPLVSDGFSVWGTTDGKGHAEGIAEAVVGQGGSEKTWSVKQGAWNVTSGKAQATALSGGVAIATVDAGDTNVIFDQTLTRSGGIVGCVLRYSDADNYLYAGHDGTNAVLVSRVSGAENTLITGAQSFGAGKLRIVIDGTITQLYWNNTRIGQATVPSSSQTLYGLYTTNVANTHDLFSIYARN